MLNETFSKKGGDSGKLLCYNANTGKENGGVWVYKEAKWAKQILDLQDEEGKWGQFHSLSKSNGDRYTTEMALRRLKRLGFTMEDSCIQRAVAYMTACLRREKEIPDPREKLHDWDIFTDLMLATWIRQFTLDCLEANRVANTWAKLITESFQSGTYCHESYVASYLETFGMKPRGGRLVDFVNFYPIALLPGCLDEDTESSFLDYILQHETGIYYIYENRLTDLPSRFQHRKTSYYLAALELLAVYSTAGRKLSFAADWLLSQRNDRGTWDMGSCVNDKIYFPLSDSWRKRETREADCTYRITNLLNKIG